MMPTRTNHIRYYSKISTAVVGYALLALFMLFLAYMTYRYGGGLADWKSIITITALTMMFFITGWLAVTSRREQ